MQNLKFRIWAADSNRFYFLDSIFNTPDPCYTGEIQQFTGLIDSHGVEIYEGDVVYAPQNIYQKRLTVEWGYDRWEFKEEFDNGDYYNGYAVLWEEVEVLGNIYEHEYLLTEGR